MKETTSQLKKPIEVHDIFFEDDKYHIDPETLKWNEVNGKYSSIMEKDIEFYDGTRHSKATITIKQYKIMDNCWEWKVRVRKNKETYEDSGYEDSLEKAKLEAVRSADEITTWVLLDTC